ncbi:Tc toxin subunit A [Xenorhabdus bovienii]|uniref:Tc toxin subunit A n=1 Tax=Xenorhabdus bovienii TaxID=40576 RepID=UPI00061D13DB|nr:Tc toxin subunit A [Xenorhabdus bovienii]
MANILESRTSYKTLFNDNQDLYCLPGLPETNDGPLAYLVDLYQQTRLFESEADKDSVRFLSQRCPDIETLLLDSTNLNKTSSLLPLIIEALAQKVKAHINKNQPLTNSLAEIHYPLALPFHFPLKQTIAVLAEKELPLLELIQQADRQYPNFIDNNLSSDSLQTAMMVSSSLAPKLQTLLQEKSQSDQKDFFAKYYGVKGDAAEAALSLSRLTVFTQQTNLSSQEAERLFAINGLSDNKITHSIVTYSSNVAKPTNAGKQFPSGANYAASFINAGTEPAIYLAKTVDPKTAKDVVLLKEISNDNFDRIQRFLHIQKALKLTSEQLDLLLVTARQAEKQQDFAITEATLRALGVFLHFQQEYSTTAEQFAAFIGQITPYSLENKLSFFDRLFNASGLSQQAASSSVLVLDNQEFDPSTIEGLDALTVNQLCAGLKIDDATCQILLSLIMQAQTLTKPKRSLDVVSALYRLVELPRLLKLPVKEGLGLLLLLNNDNPNYLQQLAGVPVLSKNAEDIDILDVMVGVMNAAQWIKRHELSTLSLNLLLTPYQPDANGVTSEDIENIDWLKKVISILPDQQYALLSEDKIAAAMMGFQAKQIPVNWMKSFSELVDENMGIIQGDLVSADNSAEKALSEEVGKILQELAEEEAWKAQGDTWTQILTVLIRDAFIAQQDLVIKAISHAFNLDETLSLPLLLWTGNNQATFLRDSISLATPAGDPQLKAKAVATWYDLNRYTAIVKSFKLTAKTIQALIGNPGWFGLNLPDDKLRDLDLTFLHRLSRYGDWLDLLANHKTEDDVLYYLSQANQIGQTPPLDNIWTTEQAANNLAELIGWTSKEIQQVTNGFEHNVAQNVIGISTIMRVKVLAEKSDISAQPLLDAAKLSNQSDYDHWQQVSSALFAACTQEEQTKLEGSLNELWRDALIEYLLGQWAPSDDNLSDITTVEDLSNYFLTDLQVATEVSTSRVAFAIASLQRYLFRLFSRLETGYGVQTISDERIEHWNRNLSQYGHWQAWQKQRNFPENFIDPARRLRKTRAFADLENDLGQSRLNNNMIQTAILRYLTEFERISNLQLVSGYIDGTDPENDYYHFIGKNNAEPVEYYWRTLDIKMRDDNDRISPLAWSEWEKITLSLSGTLLALRPIVISGRQYTIWVEREASPLMSADQKPSDYRAINVKFTYKQSNGEWSAPNTLFRLDGTDSKGEYPTKDGKRVPDNENPYLKDEKYKPGLIAMVDIQREGDPWMGVLLYDITKTDSSVWKKNQDYFLELRDLLLVDKKALNNQDENTLISSWYKIFKNSDTLQHHYVGTEKFIEYKASEDNKNLILKLDAKLSGDKTKLILTGTNTLIKRNPKGYGTKFKIFNNIEFLSKLPTEDFDGTIKVDNSDKESIKIHIPASQTSLKTFHLTWQGDQAPTSTFTVSYGSIILFTVSPNEWKDNTVTKLAELNWLNGIVSQRSETWKPDTSALVVTTKNKGSRGRRTFDVLYNWEYTKSKLTLTLDTPSGTAPTIKEVILNGSATTEEITIPIRANIDEYSFTLSATLETEDSGANQPLDYTGTVSNKYQIIVRESDRIPVITLSRNTKQAQYLDITSLGFRSTAIRLNTLFGKQLVARATQSIEQVLSWDTQSLLEPTLDDSTSSTPIDFSGANGIYFWELFFHLPFLVTYRLSEEQRFYDARRWLLNYLFDPYGSMRMWNSRPIIENGSNLPPSVKEDDSDTIAYSLPVYYQKTLFHFQITLWIQEGDNLYRQLTRDSLNEASLCYQQALQLLGTLPEGLDVTGWYPVTLEQIKADFEPDVRVVDGRSKLAL